MTDDDGSWIMGDEMPTICTQVQAQAEALAAEALNRAIFADETAAEAKTVITDQPELTEEEKERIWNLVVQTCR